jgi:hypothetical protein
MTTFCAAILLLIASPPFQGQTSSVLGSEEYAIYTVVLNELYVRGESYLVLTDHTTIKPLVPITRTLRLAAKQIRGGISPELRNDFEMKNGVRYPLEDRFNLGIRTILIGQAELDRLIGDEWIEFLKKYPAHSAIEFSRVGFNTRADRALVYAGNPGGPKSGSGFLIVLSKRNNNWTIDQKVFVWLS